MTIRYFNEMASRLALAKMIRIGDGRVLHNRYVTRPGVFDVTDHSSIQPSATFQEILDFCLIDYAQFGLEFSLVQFMCHVTYANFGDEKALQHGAKAYVHKILSEYHHHSVIGNSYPVIALFGVSVEIISEFLSHGTDRTGRLCSSAANAMKDPLYIVLGTAAERQDEILRGKEHLKLEEDWRARFVPQSHYGETESLPRSSMATKAICMIAGMSLVEWHWFLQGRMKASGNEAEIRILAHRICLELRKTEIYREIIQEPKHYGWDNDPFGVKRCQREQAKSQAS